MKSHIQCVLLLLLLVATSNRAVFASSFYECDLKAVVSEVQAGNRATDEDLPLKVTIKETIKNKHDDTRCEFESGEKNIIVVADSADILASIDIGELLLINYAYSSGMGQNGVVESETWKVLAILNDSDSIGESCEQF